jgi:hypothetical protein
MRAVSAPRANPPIVGIRFVFGTPLRTAPTKDRSARRGKGSAMGDYSSSLSVATTPTVGFPSRMVPIRQKDE